MIRSIPRPRIALALSVFGLLSACGVAEPRFCTEEARAGITVEVLDAATGLPAADGATLTLREADYVETWTDAFNGRTLAGAWERAGTYEVTVARPGYATWVRSGVEVTEDECHVIPVSLRAELQSL